MASYEYICKNRDHPHQIIVCSMFDMPEIECSVCRGRMHRKPQPFRHYISPNRLIVEWAARNTRHKRNGEPREIMYDQVTLDTGIPQKDYHTRK